MRGVIVYGTVCLDQFVRIDDAGNPLAAGFVEMPGGEAFNTATALAGWGVPVMLTGTAFGVDEESERLKRLLDTSPLGLSRELVPTYEKAVTPVCTVRVAPDGERFMSGRGYAQAVAPPPLPSSLFHVKHSPVFAVDPNLGEAALLETKRAKQAGCPVVAMDMAHFAEILPFCDVVLESEERHRHAGKNRSPETWAVEWAARGAKTVIVTQGKQGGIVAENKTLWRYEAANIPPVVDTTGAGDTFRAGICYGIVQGWDTQKTVRFAAVAAALHCQVQGGGSRIPLSTVLSHAFNID